jgi:predicted Rdx family selenoprotein
VRAGEDLLHHYQHVIESLTFVTGSKGVFDVLVDGTTIFSKHALGRHAEPGEVLREFEAHIGPDVRRYER